jgi:hypothetical protein
MWLGQSKSRRCWSASSEWATTRAASDGDDAQANAECHGALLSSTSRVTRSNDSTSITRLEVGVAPTGIDVTSPTIPIELGRDARRSLSRMLICSSLRGETPSMKSVDPLSGEARDAKSSGDRVGPRRSTRSGSTSMRTSLNGLRRPSGQRARRSTSRSVPNSGAASRSWLSTPASTVASPWTNRYRSSLGAPHATTAASR